MTGPSGSWRVRVCDPVRADTACDGPFRFMERPGLRPGPGWHSPALKRGLCGRRASTFGGVARSKGLTFGGVARSKGIDVRGRAVKRIRRPRPYASAVVGVVEEIT